MAVIDVNKPSLWSASATQTAHLCVAVLSRSKFWTPLKRAAPRLCPCLLVPGSKGQCSCTVGAEPEETSLSLPACSLVHPAAPERWGWQSRHEDPITHFCSSSWQRWGRHRRWGTARTARDPANHQACVGLQLAQAASGKGLFSRSVETWMQPRSRLSVGTRAFVRLLFFLVLCSTCAFTSSQQWAISTSAGLEMKQKLLLDKLFKYLFLFKGTLWISQLNKIWKWYDKACKRPYPSCAGAREQGWV